jgi:hypothetical protein
MADFAGASIAATLAGDLNRCIMSKHFLFVGVAVGLGLLVGALGKVGLKVLAILSLIGGPGLYEGLNALAERSDFFWLVTGAVAAVVAGVIYLIWGIVWLVQRRKRGQA